MPISDHTRRRAARIVSGVIERFVNDQLPRRFIYPLGENGQGGVLIRANPVVRVNDEDRFDNGDTPVKGGLLLI